MNCNRVVSLTVLWMALFVAHCERWLVTLSFPGLEPIARTLRTPLPKGQPVHINGRIWRVSKVECAK